MPRTRRRSPVALTERAEERAPAPQSGPRPKPGVGSALADLSIWEQFSRLGGGLTPLDVSAIIRQADSGDPSRLIDLANECRQKDAHLQSVLFTRESALAGLEWELVLPGARRKRDGGARKRAPRGERERRFVEDHLRTLDAVREDRDAVGLRELIQHLTGGAFYGHAVGENLFVLDSRGRLVPRGFALHSARRFGFERTRGELALADGRGQWVDFRTPAPHRFIVSQPRITGDVQAREGLMRVLVWACLFRGWTLQDWLKLAELAWKPWRLGRYKKGSSTEDIAQLERILRTLTSSGAATHSEDVVVDLKWPDKGGGGPSGHGDLHSRMAAEMSKAVLGQTLTTEVGASGSRALGQVHDKVRSDILEFDAKHVAAVITRDIVRPMVELNFGPTAPVPVFRFVTDEAADMKATSEALAILVGQVGMKVPAAWAHEQMGIPVAGEDEEVLTAPSAQVAEGEDEDDDATDDEPEPTKGQDDEKDDSEAE